MKSDDFISELIGPKPFSERPLDRDWIEAERELGIIIDSNFKELVSATGSGVFGSGLIFLNPSASTKGGRLCLETILEQSAIVSSGWRKPPALYPAIPGIIVLGLSNVRYDFGFQVSSDARMLPEVIGVDHEHDKLLACASSCTDLISQFARECVSEPRLAELLDLLFQRGDPLFTPKSRF